MDASTDDAATGFSSSSLSESTLAEIVRRIRSVMCPERIILFGSAATGTMTPGSDIDLLIVGPDARHGRAEYPRLRRALWDLDYPFDIAFISKDWYERSKSLAGGIAHSATDRGRVIYDAS